MIKLRNIVFRGNKVDRGYNIDNMLCNYTLNNNVFDSLGNHHAVPSGLFFESGNEGENALFKTGSYELIQSHFTIPYHTDFDFGDVVDDKPFSITGMFRFDAAGGNQWLVTKRGSVSANFEWQFALASGSLYMDINDTNAVAYLDANCPFVPVADQWYHLAMTYDGSALSSGIKIYIDGVAQSMSYAPSGVYVQLQNNAIDITVGTTPHNMGLELLGGIDGLTIWDIELGQPAITAIEAIQAAGDPLIGVTDEDYQDTIIGKEVLNNEQGHLNLALAPHHYNSKVYYQNNLSVFGVQGNVETTHEQYMYLFNHLNGKLSKSVSWGTMPTGDYHSIIICIFLPDGKILTAHEHTHSVTAQFKRSDNAYDISSFTTVATVTDSQTAYNGLYLIGNRVYNISRTNLRRSNGVRWSDDWGDTWTAITNLFDFADADYHWAYPVGIYSTTKLMYFVNRRNTTPSNDFYDKIYYLESADGVTWSNKAGTFSQNISTTGTLTQAEMDTNYLVREPAPYDTNYIGGTASWNDEPFYIASQWGDTSDPIIFGYYNSGWQVREIDLDPDVPYLFLSGSCSLLAHSALDFTLYCTALTVFDDPPNGQGRIIKITTDDAFVTYSFEYVTEDGGGLEVTPITAYNFTDSQKTPVISAVGKVYGSGSVTDPASSFANIKLIDVIN